VTEVILLSEVKTGDPQIDELMKIKILGPRIVSVQPLPANTRDEPALVRIRLGAEAMEVTIADLTSSYNFKFETAKACDVEILDTFANAPGMGNSLFGIPTSGFALTTQLAETTGGVGGTSTSGLIELSDLTLITGLVPETPCLFGWMFFELGNIRLDSYASALDLNPILSLSMIQSSLVGFELESNSAGGVDLRLRFAYAALQVDYGGTSVGFPADNHGS
jgi:hypothetical protein